jgi:hypothetical protein
MYNNYMKIIAKATVVLAMLLSIPLLASAQAFNTSTVTQQSFLTELQSLQQELSALAATINAMIVAVGGTVSSPTAISPTTSSSILPLILPTIIGGLPINESSGDISSQLLQAIIPSVSTTTFIAIPKNTATTAVRISGGAPVSTQSIASQFDPSCLSMLFANNAQCGGLYYCSTGSYWSSSMCLGN